MPPGVDNFTEAFPDVDDDFAFDRDDNGAETVDSWEAHSMQRTIEVGPGEQFIQVQAAIVGDSATFRLDDWILTAQSFVDLT